MSNTTFIWGKNAVTQALQERPELIEKVWIEKGRDFPEVEKLLKSNNIKKEIFAGDIPREVADENHQGIFAKVSINDLLVNFEYFIENLQIDKNTCLVVLSEIEDVQNVGSIIRSATALGVSGILLSDHNQAQITGTVVKISTGTAFSIPLVKIGNINTTLEKLKKSGFWIYGLDMYGEKTIFEENYTEPTVFIVGNEGSGLREKTKEHCDMVLNIPISEKAESMNAGVSTAIAIYEWRKQNFK